MEKPKSSGTPTAIGTSKASTLPRLPYARRSARATRSEPLVGPTTRIHTSGARGASTVTAAGSDLRRRVRVCHDDAPRAGRLSGEREARDERAATRVHGDIGRREVGLADAAELHRLP